MLARVGCLLFAVLTMACSGSAGGSGSAPTTPDAATPSATEDTAAAPDLEPPPPPEPTCDDKVINGAETGRDCGGGTCAPCGLADGCVVNADCTSGKCTASMCVEALGTLLGLGDGGPTSVTWTPIVTQKLDAPADLAFNPQDPDELYVVNEDSDSVTIVTKPGTPDMKVARFVDQEHHFLEQVVTVAFGDQGTFATCGDSRNTYNDQAPGNDFMGPVLWPSGIADFQFYGPDASAVHLDMLHNSPLCTGIAADTGNAFYVVNGFKGTIDWYDFKAPHEHGATDHSDGIKRRYAGVGLVRKAGVPSHMVLADDGWLYVADTGNSRIVRLDTATGKKTGTQQTYPDEHAIDLYTGANVQVVVEAKSGTLFDPSGIELDDDTLYVTDNANGVLSAFDLEGHRTNVLDSGLGEGALAGLTVGPDGKLWLVDRLAERVVRIDP